MDLVTRILGYLKYLPGSGLLYLKNNHLEVGGYSQP